MHLPSYILGGISFGFAVLCQARIDNKCKAVIGIEPFTGKSAHVPGNRKKLLSKFSPSFLELLYRSPISKLALKFAMNLHPHLINIILQEIDPKTFVDTGLMILNDVPQVTYHPVPHLLIMNPHDQTLDYEHTLANFRSRVPRLAVLDTDLPHFPPDLSYDYLAQKLPADQIHTAINKLKSL